jgi:hypothetical protein
MGTGTAFPRGKGPGREADHSSPTSAEVKKTGSKHKHPHMLSWRSGQLVNHMEKVAGGCGERAYFLSRTDLRGPVEIPHLLSCDVGFLS